MMLARDIVVLGRSPVDQKELSEVVKSAGFTPTPVETFDELLQRFERRPGVALCAFEALWPDPQRLLKELRSKSPASGVVVAHFEGGPRNRLGQRLWSAGLLDFFVSRTSPLESIRPALRQAWGDAISRETLLAPNEAASDDPTHRALRILSHVGAALSNHDELEVMLHELHRRLPALVDYRVMSVLVLARKRPAAFVFQNVPVDHETVWSSAQELCQLSAKITGEPLSLDRVEFIDASPPVAGGKLPSIADVESETVTVPLFSCGELVGCLGLLVSSPDAQKAVTRETLALVAHHLATSIQHAKVVHDVRTSLDNDSLTGVPNRRVLGDFLATEWARAKRYNLQLSLAIVDIDHFKKVNDNFGHLAGDAVLRQFAERLQRHLRRTDFLCRYGGEEFLLVLPETELRGAVNLLERVRLSLKTDPIAPPDVESFDINFSGGLAAVPTHGASTPEELIAMADQALYRAKRGGRGRLEIALAVGASEDESFHDDKRSSPRLQCEIPALFVPLRELDLDGKIRVSTVNVSDGGAALKTGVAQLARNTFGLVFMDERQSPHLARVAWSRRAGVRAYAGIEFVRNVGALPREASFKLTSALVFTKRPDTLASARRALLSFKHDVEVVDCVKEAPTEAQREGASLVLIGESMLREPAVEELFMQRSQSNNPLQIVVVHEEATRSQSMETMSTQRLRHYVPSTNAEEGLMATLDKLLGGKIFGVTRYLLPAADVQRWMITNKEQKDAVLEGVKRFGGDIGCHPRLMDLLIAALDEMAINALYHVGLVDEQKPVSIECGADGRFLACSVIDEHGLLVPRAIFEGLAIALRRQREGLPEDARSANLGFRIMLDSLSHVVINIDPKNRTEVIGMIDMRKSLREHRSSPPGFGIFDAS